MGDPMSALPSNSPGGFDWDNAGTVPAEMMVDMIRKICRLVFIFILQIATAHGRPQPTLGREAERRLRVDEGKVRWLAGEFKP